MQASSGVPFSTPIPMALYPTLATLLTTSGLAVTALFYVCVAAAPHPQRACEFVEVCRPLCGATACPAAWLPRRTGSQAFHTSLYCHGAAPLAVSSDKARVASAGRYEVTRMRPSRFKGFQFYPKS